MEISMKFYSKRFFKRAIGLCTWMCKMKRSE